VWQTIKSQCPIYEQYDFRVQCVACLKRLEQGTFAWPKNLAPETTKLKLTPQALAMLTDGVDLRGAKLRPWYERED
jgi:transposase